MFRDKKRMIGRKFEESGARRKKKRIMGEG